MNRRGSGIDLGSGARMATEKFDLALLFQNAFEARGDSRFYPAHQPMGYDTERRGVLLTHSLPSPSWKNERHESFYYLHIVRN